MRVILKLSLRLYDFWSCHFFNFRGPFLYLGCRWSLDIHTIEIISVVSVLLAFLILGCLQWIVLLRAASFQKSLFLCALIPAIYWT